MGHLVAGDQQQGISHGCQHQGGQPHQVGGPESIPRRANPKCQRQGQQAPDRRHTLRGAGGTLQVGHGPRQGAIKGSRLLPAERGNRGHGLGHGVRPINGAAGCGVAYSSRIFIDNGVPDWALIVTIL